MDKKPIDKKIDPQSKAMWDELKSLTPLTPGEQGACCVALRRMIAEGMTSCSIYNSRGYVLYYSQVNFCPQCGRPVR